MGSADPIRVLHVDDEPTLTELTAKALESLDPAITVDTATSAGEGLSRVEEGAYDCIVSDYDMPGQDGLDFLASVRGHHGAIPFILFTGKGGEEVASQAISAGVTDYLQKGDGRDQYTVLANRIRNAVERHRMGERFESFLESAPDAILVAGAGGVIRRANGQARELFGYDREELVGMTVEELVPERFRDDQVGYREAHAEDPETRPTGEDLDLYALHADGTEIPVDIAVSPVELGGQVETMVAIRDISDRKSREEKLREREQALVEANERLRAAIEASPQAVMVVDRQGRVELWNPAAEEIFGWTEEEVLGQYNPIIPEGRVDEFEEWVDDVLAGDPVVGVETTRRDKDGDPVEVEISTAAIRDAHGEPVGAMGVITDINGRKERERRLEQAETVFEHSDDALFLLDVESGGETWRLAWVNPGYAEQTGVPRDEVEGRTIAEVFGEDLEAQIAPEIRRCIEEGEALSDELALEHEALPPHWELTLAPVHADGEVSQIVGITRNVTDLKEREEELRRHHREAEAERDRRAVLFEECPDPIMEVGFDDGEPRIRSVNEAFEDVFGYETDHLAGWTVAETVVPEDRRHRHEALADRVRRGETVQVTVERETADGLQEFLLRVIPRRLDGQDGAYAWYTET